MDTERLKQKLKELRQQYPAASFAWIWNKAHELLQPESQPDHDQIGQFSSFSDHVAFFEKVRKQRGEPIYRAEGGWDIPP
jgi:hypothetical protein